MQKLTFGIMVAGLLFGMSMQAEAKGCLKGAAVGGVAGHVAHHGVAGAAAGCAVGHHMAKKKEKRSGQSTAKPEIIPFNVCHQLV
ncbi:hypothetical protein HA41_03190 [Pantoea conspicua]|uniref:Glycine zipper 2TM domain protein n=1 Tax=Pantoea conspicua TaxID=472705 RepID=A0A1X1C0Q1_9GAMM|nr:hypothetical protein [Pantoea conspicua]ORM54990.1 hypothetical protein HA41_03190 [Pantoea conspicua]